MYVCSVNGYRQTYRLQGLVNISAWRILKEFDRVTDSPSPCTFLFILIFPVTEEKTTLLDWLILSFISGKCHPAMTSFVSLLPDNSLDIQSSRTNLGRRRPGVVGAGLFNHRLGISSDFRVQTERIIILWKSQVLRSWKWAGISIFALSGSSSSICNSIYALQEDAINVVQLSLYWKKTTTTTDKNRKKCWPITTGNANTA